MGKSKDAFRTISEVAEWLDTQAHVLRFWESKFSQVKPVKRAGGRRYYRPADMMLLGGIKKLLHDDGMTIKGAQKLLREKGVKHVSGLSQPLEEELTDELRSKPVKEAVETAAVLEFAKPTVSEPLTDEDLSDMAKIPLVTDEATVLQAAVDDPAEVEENNISPEDVPAFVQRSTPSKGDAAEDDDLPVEDAHAAEAAEPVVSDILDAETVPEETVTEDTEADADVAPPADPIVKKTSAPSADDTPKEETKDLSMEPGNSLLPQLARSTGIAQENRASTKDLIQRLQALCTRIAEHENA